MGPVGGIIANILAFQASAKATVGMLEWGSSASRRVAGFMAKEISRSKVIRNENFRRSSVQFLESDPVGRASRTGRMYASRVMRSVENHPDKHFRIGARAAIHAVKDEALYLPANYMMYRVAKFNARTPDEKEETATFRKYYFGTPMLISIGGGVAVEQALPKTRNFLNDRVHKVLSKRMDTAKVREIVRKSNNVASAGSDFLNKFNAHRMAVKTAVSDKGMLFALGRTKGSWNGFANSYSSEYNKFYNHYKRNAYDHVANLQSTISRYVADSHSEMSNYLEKTKFSSDGARSKYISDRAQHVKDSIYRMVESHNTHASRPTAFMKAAEFAGVHAEHQFVPLDMKRAVLSSGKFRYTDTDFASLPKVAKRYGAYNVGGKSLNLGSMSFDALSDNLVDTFSKGMTGTVLGMFGLNDAFKSMSARNSLTTMTRHVASPGTKLVLGKSFMPSRSGDAVYNHTMEEQKDAFDVAHQMTGLRGADAEDFIGSRVAGKRTVTGESKYSMFLNHARHGTLMLNQGDLVVMHPGGHMKLESTVGGGNSRRTITSDVSGATGIRYLGFSSAHTRAAKIMSSALGNYSTDIHDELGASVGKYYYGPNPYEGSGTDAIGMFGKIAKAIDVGQSDHQSAFSRVMSVFTKHMNPKNNATLFSSLFLENNQWRENTAKSVRGSFDLANTLRKARNSASTEFVMRMKQKVGSKNLVNALSELDSHVDVSSDLSYSKYLITEGDTLDDAAEKSKSFSDFVSNIRGKAAAASPYDRDISEINHLQSLFPTGRNGYVADIADTTYRGKVKPSSVLGIGRGYRVTAVDEYNGKVLSMVGTERRLQGFADPFDEIMRGKQKYDYGEAGQMISHAVTSSEKSAFITSSHVNEMYHKVSTELHKVPAGDLDALKGAPGDTIRDHIIHMTGSGDPDWTTSKQYFINSDGVASTWHNDGADDNLARHGDQIFAYPGRTKSEGIFKRIPVDLTRGIHATQGVLNVSNMSSLHVARAFNDVLGAMGLGFSDSSFGTLGDITSNIVLKRVLPAGAIFAGVDIADHMAKQFMQDTPLGEGFGVAALNTLATVRLGSQGILDSLHMTDATKYMEDLMPGSITSPASGLARGIGPVVAGLALGRKFGPQGAVTGGIVGAAVGALVGGLPLGVFGEWDISKSRNQMVDEYTGKEQVAVRKGRWWELGCLRDISQIRTKTGYKKIAEVTTDDLVLSHDNTWNKILGITTRAADHYYSMRLSYLPKDFANDATGNHPMFVKGETDNIWKRYDELTPDDYLAYPKPKRIRRKMYFNISDFIRLDNKLFDNNKIYTRQNNTKGGFQKSGNPVPSDMINLDYHMGLIFGAYLGDGNVNSSGNRIQGIEFAVAVNDGKEAIDKLLFSIRKCFGLVGNVTTKGNMHRIRVSNEILGELFTGIFGTEKHIPDWMHEVKSDAFYKGLLEGIIDTAGSVSDSVTFKNTNIDIVHLFWETIISLYNIVPSVNSSTPMKDDGNHYLTSYIVRIGKLDSSILLRDISPTKGSRYIFPATDLEKTDFNNTKSDLIVEDEYLYFKILEITRTEVTHTVYDIHVDTAHSFTGFGITYHNSTPFEGTRIEYFRPSMYALARSDYKHAPGFKDSLATELIGSIAPDVYATKNYYSRPYPVTSGLFSNIPVVSNLLNMTGASKLLGGGREMHPGDMYSAEKQFGSARTSGFSTATLADMYENNDGVYSNTGRNPGRKGFGPDAIEQSSFAYGAGETINQAMDIVGIRGFAASTLANGALGQDSFFSDAPIMAAPTDISGIRSYWDMSLGGMLGMCIVENTPVKTIHGSFPIESIRDGDLVFTGKGYSSVIATSVRKTTAEETVLDIKGELGVRLSCTSNHVIPVLRRKTHGKKHKHLKPFCSKNYEILEVSAEQIVVGDYLFYPIDKIENDLIIDLASYYDVSTDKYVYNRATLEFAQVYELLENNNGLSRKELRDMGFKDKTSKEALSRFRDGSNVHRTLRYHKITEEFAYAIGWFIAEGNVDNGNRLSYTMHANETEYADRIIAFFETLGFSGNYSIDHNSMCLRINCAQFANYFKIFGSGAKTKRIPVEYKQLPTSVLTCLVDGLMLGDGWKTDKYAERQREGFTSTSRQLIRDLTDCLLKLNRQCNVTIDYLEKPNGFYPQGTKRKDTFRHYLETNSGIRHPWKFFEDSYLIRVSDISQTHDIYNVYDLEIEDHHYFTADGALVHNSEGIRRIIPHKRGSIDSFNPLTNTMPNWLPGSEYYLDFKSGDPYTVVPMGEARLPGAGYLLSHSAEITMPIAGEVMGEQVDSQVAYLLGFPEYMSDRNKKQAALKPIVNDFLDQTRAAGDLLHVHKTAYNAKYDVHATVDAIVRGDKGQDIAVKFVPQGFAGQSDINAFMTMSGTTEGLLMQVTDDGSYTTERVYQDSDRFLEDMRRGKKAGMVANRQMRTLESQGKAMNYGNALSWLERLKILSDVAPYSKETQTARGIVKAQRQAGSLTKEQEQAYFTTLDQVREKQEYMNFDEYRFKDMGTHITEYGKTMDEFYTKEYSSTEQTVGSVWERFAHIKTPINSKLLHRSNAMEEYERNYIYGKLMPQWNTPINDFLGTYANRMANTDSVSQSSLSWATGGLLLGGAPLAMPMAAAGAIMGQANKVFGQSLPDEVQRRREVMYQSDLVEYSKYRDLEQEGNHRSYAIKAANTLTAYGVKGMGPDVSKIGQYLGNPESYFVKNIINNMTTDDLDKARTFLPQPALASLYREMGHAGQSAAVMKDFGNKQMSRYMPGEDSSVYSADVTSDAPYITTLAQEGLNLHDAGMGWSSQMKNIANLQANGMYTGETVYGNAGSGRQLSNVLSKLDSENAIRKSLASISTSVSMLQDGSDTIEITLIER